MRLLEQRTQVLESRPLGVDPRVRAPHSTRLARLPRMRCQRPVGRAGSRLGAPESGSLGAVGRGAGPSIRAPARVPTGAARATQECRLPQPQWAGG
eukprot:662197-Alexandrium_andersonii.AAC.1